jgi:ADP-ribosyl-[dinitrogen reductase] hydrolase
MPAFAAMVEDLAAALRAGATVVVHCRGGLGRSGTVAAACLVRLGLSHAKAMSAVREARPGAIEVQRQEAWVRRYAGSLGDRRSSVPA